MRYLRILFICSSLEPGRDGVGDYTRRLACELIRQGHQASIIALYDKNSISNVVNGEQIDDGQQIDTLRLSNQLSWKSRIKIATIYLKSFDPEWVSLQYVPFGFQKKGLPFCLSNRLKDLVVGRKQHIMFHELWVGMNREATNKYFAWGHVQKILIKIMLRNLKPRFVHTQTHLYQLYLANMGVEAHILPLFGHIPVVQNMYHISEHINDSLRFVIFGTIHPGSPVNQFVVELLDYSVQTSKPVSLLFLGRNGSELEFWTSTCKKEGLSYKVLGQQTSEKVSKILLASNFGIITTPFFLSEKSSVLATLREHKLPVICMARKWTPSGVGIYDLPNVVFPYEPGSLFSFLENKEHPEKDCNVFDVVTQMANDIRSVGY